MLKRLFHATLGLLLLLLLWHAAPVLAQGQPQRRVTGTCPPGASIRVINADGSVVCEVDDNSGGTVTSVGTGSGLTGGPITTTGTISIAPGGVTSAHIADGTIGAADVDQNQIQRRVTTVCAPGSSIRVINADGSVVCETDDGGATTASPPLVISGGNISLPNVIIEDDAFTANTAIGANALSANSGFNNTASGFNALSSNTTGSRNTASGAGALVSNTTGDDNTVIGGLALLFNTTGTGNTASGVFALQQNKTGSRNTASGDGALSHNTTGDDNIAIGFGAGANHSTGSRNIYVGNPGVGAESGTIRIGDCCHTGAFIAGISGVPVVGAAVFVDSDGQLGILASSRRFKEEIQDIGEASRGLMRLRPVSFRYKKEYADGSRPLEYGLIAEEVAEVYPEVVGYAATGEAQSVQYHKVNVLLLHEVQQQHRKIEEQREELKALKAETAQLKASLETLGRMLGPVAQR